MNAFLDTSVLVAAFQRDHEQHETSLSLFLRHNRESACCGAHSLAEVYSVLTGVPRPWRISGHKALLVLDEIRARLTPMALDEEEYYQVVHSAAEAGLIGGAIYDAILGQCALKAGAEAIYTWNEKDFRRLGPAIAERVKSPIERN